MSIRLRDGRNVQNTQAENNLNTCRRRVTSRRGYGPSLRRGGGGEGKKKWLFVEG